MTLVNGKYAVEGLLGEGAMATVHRAIHVATHRPVVIKRPHERLLADPVILERFEREARAAGRIRSRHVVDILDVDRDAEGPYLVMELLDGESLADRVDRTIRIDPHTLVTYIDQLLAGAGAAHRAGVVHRDLKTANVFLAREDGEERLKILDFGISKFAEKDQRELTQAGAIVGTIPYVSPEQIAGVAGPQSDLWAIGIITYRCLAGYHAFGDDELITLARILNQEPSPLPDDLPPDVVAAFTPFLQRALAKPLAARFQNADEMRAALEHVRAALPVPIFAPAPSAPVATPSHAMMLLPPDPMPVHRGPARAGFLGPRPDSALAVFACAFALVTGVAAGVATGREELRPTFAVDVGADHALVAVDGALLSEPHRVPVGHSIDVSAPGFTSRNVPPPSRLSGRLIVGLAPAPAPSPVILAPPPPPAPAPFTTAPVAANPAPVVEEEPVRPGAPFRTPIARPRPPPAPAPAPARSAIKPIVRPPF